MSKSRLTQAVVLGPAGRRQPGQHDRRRRRPVQRRAHQQAERTAAAHPRPGRRSPRHRRLAAANQSAIAGHRQQPPTEGQWVGEPWHPRQSVPMRLDKLTNQPGGLVAALAVLAAASALAGGLPRGEQAGDLGPS